MKYSIILLLALHSVVISSNIQDSEQLEYSATRMMPSGGEFHFDMLKPPTPSLSKEHAWIVASMSITFMILYITCYYFMGPMANILSSNASSSSIKPFALPAHLVRTPQD